MAAIRKRKRDEAGAGDTLDELVQQATAATSAVARLDNELRDARRTVHRIQMAIERKKREAAGDRKALYYSTVRADNTPLALVNHDGTLKRERELPDHVVVRILIYVYGYARFIKRCEVKSEHYLLPGSIKVLIALRTCPFLAEMRHRVLGNWFSAFHRRSATTRDKVSLRWKSFRVVDTLKQARNQFPRDRLPCSAHTLKRGPFKLAVRYFTKEALLEIECPEAATVLALLRTRTSNGTVARDVARWLSEPKVLARLVRSDGDRIVLPYPDSKDIEYFVGRQCDQVRWGYKRIHT